MRPYKRPIAKIDRLDIQQIDRDAGGIQRIELENISVSKTTNETSKLQQVSKDPQGFLLIPENVDEKQMHRMSIRKA